jgi:hypothetical protein
MLRTGCSLNRNKFLLFFRKNQVATELADDQCCKNLILAGNDRNIAPGGKVWV